MQLTPVPEADSKQFAAAEQECMAWHCVENLMMQPTHR